MLGELNGTGVDRVTVGAKVASLEIGLDVGCLVASLVGRTIGFLVTGLADGRFLQKLACGSRHMCMLAVFDC